LLGWQADRAGLPAALIIGALFFLVTGLASAVFLIHTNGKTTHSVDIPGLTPLISEEKPNI